MIRRRTAAVALMGVLLGSATGPAATGPATAAAPASSAAETPHCFFISQMRGWKALDASTILVRVGFRSIYRLELGGTCPLAKLPDVRMITRNRGTDSVCSAVDWDLSFAQGGPGGFAVPCIVSRMRLLTPAEVAAIPAKDLP